MHCEQRAGRWCRAVAGVGTVAYGSSKEAVQRMTASEPAGVSRTMCLD